MDQKNGIVLLILSCGSRNRIIRYFKNELKGKGIVIAADQSPYAPALYEADSAVIIPSIQEKTYMDTVLSMCKEYSVTAVLSLIDPELSIIAFERRRFTEINVKVLVSDYDLVEMSRDKYMMYKFLEKSCFNTPRTYRTKDECLEAIGSNMEQYPIFMKPRKGSASQSIGIIRDQDELEFWSQKCPELIFQEFMLGSEFGADVYIDMINGDVTSIFLKEKLKMRAGETDKSISVVNEDCFTLIEKFVLSAAYRGVIDIDIFKKGSDYYISEVNPRFGGGYPHAYECGVNFPRMMINNLLGKANPSQLGNYEQGIVMMKYNDVVIRTQDSIIK